MKRACIVVSVTWSLAVFGCGDDEEPPSVSTVRDGGSTTVAPDAAPADAGWPGTCDPVRQDCPPGQQCTGGCAVTGVTAKQFTCAVPAPGATATHGQDCGVGCAPGHDCYVVQAVDGGTRSVCRKYCNTNADCSNGTCAAEGLVCVTGDTSPIGRLCTL
jgi:hypothetical protein